MKDLQSFIKKKLYFLTALIKIQVIFCFGKLIYAQKTVVHQLLRIEKISLLKALLMYLAKQQ